MPLDQYSEVIIAAMGERPKPGSISPQQLRSQMGTMMPPTHTEEVFSVEDTIIPGAASQLPVRIYKPQAPAGEQLAAMVYFHGGGFIAGGIQSHDSVCRALANKVPCIIVSVEYRLAPEDPFPAAVEDCYAAAQWVHANLEHLGASSGKLAVGGDSAGGNLAAVTAMQARDHGGPPLDLVYQLLIYPAVDAPEIDGEFLYDSYKEFGPGTRGLLERDDAKIMLETYIKDAKDATDPRFAVIRAVDHKGLPPATVITCEVDPLRDEGKAYAEKLKAAGVPVRFYHYEGTFHGFLHFPVPQAGKALDAMAADLRSAFSG